MKILEKNGTILCNTLHSKYISSEGAVSEFSSVYRTAKKKAKKKKTMVEMPSKFPMLMHSI